MAVLSPSCFNSPGGRLFLAICRGETRSTPDDAAAMTAAWALAGYHGLEPLAAGYILAHPDDGWPAELRSEAKKARDFALFRNIQLLALLAEIQGALDGAGIPWIALKGPVFAGQYAGDLALRTSSDLDVLVRPVDVPQVDRLFRGLGIASPTSVSPHARPLGVRGHEHKYYSPPPRHLVELHWDLVWRTCYEIVDPEAVFRRAGTARLEGGAFPVLSPEEALLYAAMHAFEHRWDRFHQLKTMDWILIGRRGWGKETLDWNFILGSAAKTKKTRVLLLGLVLARELLHRELPQAVDARIDADPVLAALANQVCDNFGGTGPARSLARTLLLKCRALETMRDRSTLVFCTVAARLGLLRA